MDMLSKIAEELRGISASLKTARSGVPEYWTELIPGAEELNSKNQKILKMFWNYHVAEGNEAKHLSDALEMAAWDLGYQGKERLKSNGVIVYLAKILRVDVRGEYKDGLASGKEEINF